MTISSINPDDLRVVYVGDNITTLFAYGAPPFPVLGDSEIRVEIETIATGVIVTQVLNVDYTIVPASDPPGGPYPNGISVSMVVAPADTERLILLRKTDLDQDTAFSVTSKFPAKVMEGILDKLIMIVQEHKEEINRSIQFAITTLGGFLNGLPTPDAGKALIWNQTEDGLENSLINVNDFGQALIDAQAAAATASADAAAASASAAAAAAAAASVPTPDTDTVQTTDATPTAFASTFSTTNDSSGRLIVDVLAHEPATQDRMMWRKYVSYKNNSGTVTFDKTDNVALGDQVGVWDLGFNVSGTDIEVVVTGEALKTINWAYEIFQDEIT